jgi:hypothetical protein
VLNYFVKQKSLDKELAHYEEEAIKLLLQLANLYRCITNFKPNKRSNKLKNKRRRRLNRIKQGLKTFQKVVIQTEIAKMMKFEIKEMIMEDESEMKKLKPLQRSEE